MDILGIILLIIMGGLGFFLLIIAISDQIDRMRGKKMTEAQRQRTGDGEDGWGGIIALIVIIGSPIILLVLAYG
tara:strand:- start:3252 stop:3473 length:222 start_codon:yes stop_codon:yes gene_type:complete